MGRVWILLVISLNAWRDIQKKEINLMATGLLFVYGVMKIGIGGENILEQSVPLGIGGVFLGLSVLSQGGIGMGDALVLLVLGMVLPLEEYFLMLCIGLLCSAIYAVILMAFMRKGKKYELPFVPFLLLGYVGGVYLCG